MKSLKNSKTLLNLANSFAGEAQARDRYTFYAEKAKKEGHKKVESVFLEVADNERAHAKVFYDLLIKEFSHDIITVDSGFPIGFGSTLDNLKYAAEGEHHEWGSVYPEYGDIAAREGFLEVSEAFKLIASIEKHHEAKFKSLYDEMSNDLLYKNSTPITWHCINCGYIFEGTEAPASCPSCHHPIGFFEKVL
ncbi:rubrerythrin [Clostridium chrysemydis]|uniref:rubrerythrin n=1 Tax=Clostridium chrysemydis TaxID=2665504 RepID=UPI0018831644|nr:ferritin family protein [Clostridium chrysemydis]